MSGVIARWHTETLARPVAEVDSLASRAAEWSVRVLQRKQGGLRARRTAHGTCGLFVLGVWV